MSFGTPVFGTIAYSTGSSISVSLPAGLSAGDVLILICAMKPATANTGAIAVPFGAGGGWGATTGKWGGGYGGTLGPDTGNTFLSAFFKTATGGESGSASVALTNNDIAWAAMVRVPRTGNAMEFPGVRSGEDTTGGSSVSVTFASDPGILAGDLLLWAMSIPTDTATPNQFSAHAISASGVTFDTPVELGEPDSSDGNDIGGYLAYAVAASGTASGAPTVTATAASTNTNVRGPMLLIRLRDKISISPDNAAHAHAAMSPALAATIAIEPGNGVHGHTASSPALAAILVPEIDPDDADHGHTATSPAIAMRWSIGPADCLHAHSASAPDATARWPILPADADHGHAASSPDLAAVNLPPPGRTLGLPESRRAGRMLGLGVSRRSGRMLEIGG